MIERPNESAPGGMGGSGRMHDPSEAAHDLARRRWMNVAFVFIVLLNVAQGCFAGVAGWDWLEAVLLAVAAAPLGLAVKVFELRFKMAHEERERMLDELPKRQQLAFAAHMVLFVAVCASGMRVVTFALWGVWLYDFVTYYHDRPERMRHLYAITKTLDELRDFPRPWAWVLPALVCEVIRRG